jgi:hypothetical protein
MPIFIISAFLLTVGRTEVLISEEYKTESSFFSFDPSTASYEDLLTSTTAAASHQSILFNPYAFMFNVLDANRNEMRMANIEQTVFYSKYSAVADRLPRKDITNSQVFVGSV